MRVLITGATGFVAPYIARELAANGHDVHLTAPDPCELIIEGKRIRAKQCDLTDLPATIELVRSTRPSAVVHQASLSHVGQAWDNRIELVKVNVTATSNLCQAVAHLRERVMFLYASSAMVYGSSTTPLDENCLPQPVTPFGKTKLAAEFVVRSFLSEDFQPYILRAFNTVGPDQSRAFVCPAFAHRLAMTTPGGQIEVGNLEAMRDFTDVRDLARAYRLVLEKQPEEELFVLGSGEPVKIREVLATMMELANKKVTPWVNRDLLRPTDPLHLIANPSLAQEVLGWQTTIPFSQSLGEILTSAVSAVA